MTGKGIREYRDGSKYDGEFLNGKRHGEGTFETKTGVYFVGTWSENLQDGKGIIRDANGNEEIVNFRNGQRVTRNVSPTNLQIADDF